MNVNMKRRMENRLLMACHCVNNKSDAMVLVCNWGQEWEVASIDTETQYKAFTDEVIEAHVGIKIGLRNVNITLKGTQDT